MLPITIDAARIRIVLVGDGEAARRRLALLDAADAKRVELYAAAPTPDLAALAGDRLRRRLPAASELRRAQLVYLAGLDPPTAARLRRIAEDAGVLANIEDDIAGSDFHSPAVLRRGDLTVAVSTGGRSPGLAAAIRRQLDECFGAEWSVRLERAAALRNHWRAAGADGAAVARRTAAWLADRSRMVG